MLMQEQGTKMYTDAVLKTHQRVVQVSPAHLVVLFLSCIQMFICKLCFVCLSS